MKADILYPLFKQLHTAAVIKLASELRQLADDHTLNTPPIYTERGPDCDRLETLADEFITSDFNTIWECR